MRRSVDTRRTKDNKSKLSSESQTRRQYRMTHSKMAEHICDLVADGMRWPDNSLTPN
jgi:hypothetical protein